MMNISKVKVRYGVVAILLAVALYSIYILFTPKIIPVNMFVEDGGIVVLQEAGIFSTLDVNLISLKGKMDVRILLDGRQLYTAYTDLTIFQHKTSFGYHVLQVVIHNLYKGSGQKIMVNGAIRLSPF